MHDGRCLCGDVTFDVIGDPLWVAHCHCESCRRQTGSIPATFVGYKDEQVSYPGTAPVEFESSPNIFRAFCVKCGSAMHYRRPGETHLYLGVFDDPSQHRATRHVFYDEHIHGYELSDNLPRFSAGSSTPSHWGEQPTRNILFLCTGNSARSILAEALANRWSLNGIRAFSAGSQPVGQVNPEAIECLRRHDMDPNAYRSKSWDEFTDGIDIDWVITLCDSAAQESCPVFPGSAEREHWGLPDPATGAITFDEVYEELETRIQEFMRR